MAIKKSFNFLPSSKLKQMGSKTAVLGEPNASSLHIRVASVDVKKDVGVATVLYLTESSAVELSSNRVEFPYDLDGENPIKQAYEYIKTLPEFEGAEDC